MVTVVVPATLGMVVTVPLRLLLLLVVLAATRARRVTPVLARPALARVVTRPVVRALPTAAPVALETLGRVARSLAVLAAEAPPTVLPVVPARAVVLVVGTPARPVAVRPEPVRVALATALLVRATRRVAPVVVQVVRGTAVPVVTLQVPRLRVRRPRVVPVLLAPRIAALVVPVVLPTPVLVRPVRVVLVRPVRVVLPTPVPARPVVLAIAVLVGTPPVVPAQLVRPVLVATARAVRAGTPPLPAVPVRAGRVVTARAQAVMPPRARSLSPVAPPRVAVRPVAPAVTPRRRVGMARGRPVPRLPRLVPAR